MMVNLYQTFSAELTNEQLFEWHSMACNGRRDLSVIDNYRTNEADDPMQVVSNRLDIDRPKVHFEAPSSGSTSVRVDAEDITLLKTNAIATK